MQLWTKRSMNDKKIQCEVILLFHTFSEAKEEG